MKDKHKVFDKIARNDKIMKYVHKLSFKLNQSIHNNNVFKQLISNYQLEQFDSL